jgi:hypothetical protein
VEHRARFEKRQNLTFPLGPRDGMNWPQAERRFRQQRSRKAPVRTGPRQPPAGRRHACREASSFGSIERFPRPLRHLTPKRCLDDTRGDDIDAYRRQLYRQGSCQSPIAPRAGRRQPSYAPFLNSFISSPRTFKSDLSHCSRSSPYPPEILCQTLASRARLPRPMTKTMILTASMISAGSGPAASPPGRINPTGIVLRR